MYSQYLENSSARAVPAVITFVLALFLQGMAMQVNADEISASFERMLNPGDTTVQSATPYQAEPDPLYTMVNAALWSTPTSHDTIAHDAIASSFEHMLAPRETAERSVASYQAEPDPLYTLVSASLWSAPTGHGNIASSFERMLTPRETAERSVATYQAEPDPLYTVVSASLWSAPTGHDNIALIFERMLAPRDTAERSVASYQAKPDPLYIVNVTLWNTPESFDNNGTRFLAYVQPSYVQP